MRVTAPHGMHVALSYEPCILDKLFQGTAWPHRRAVLRPYAQHGLYRRALQSRLHHVVQAR